MPAVNIPARARLGLYLTAAVSLLVVQYLVERGWAGDAEFRLVAGLAALASGLAAANVDLSEGAAPAGLVAQYQQGERGATDLQTVVAVVLILAFCLFAWALLDGPLIR